MVHRHRSPTGVRRSPRRPSRASGRPPPRCPRPSPAPTAGLPGTCVLQAVRRRPRVHGPARRHTGTRRMRGEPASSGLRTSHEGDGRGRVRTASPTRSRPSRLAPHKRTTARSPSRQGRGGPRPRLSSSCPLGTADRAIPDVRRTPRGTATGRHRPTMPGRCTAPGHGRASRHRSGRPLAPVPRGSHPAGPLQVPPRASRAGAGSSLSRAGPAGGRGPPPWAGSAERRPRSPPAPRSCRWG